MLINIIEKIHLFSTDLIYQQDNISVDPVLGGKAGMLMPMGALAPCVCARLTQPTIYMNNFFKQIEL